MHSPEVLTRIQAWRHKSAAGTLSIEEMREAVALLRGARRSAAESSASKPRTSRTKSPTRSADDMLGELGSL